MHFPYSIISNAIFVDLIPFCCLFVCPLSVAGHTSGRYFLTASAVNPGHVVSCLFSIALINVAFGGQNRHWWRYCINSCLDVIWYALFTMWSVMGIVRAGSFWMCCLFNGRVHKPVVCSLVPCHTIFWLWNTVT